MVFNVRRKDDGLVVRRQSLVGRMVFHLVLGRRHHAAADAHLLFVLQRRLVHLEDLENEGPTNAVNLRDPLSGEKGQEWGGISANRWMCGEFCIRLMNTWQKLASNVFDSLQDDTLNSLPEEVFWRLFKQNVFRCWQERGRR